jgi:small subunit ribosomal protein S14
MAKKSVTLRNERRKKLAAKHEPIRAELRRRASNPKLSDEERATARAKLQSMPRNGSRIRIRNRCQMTGRSRGVFRKFMISRIVFREMAHRGLIPGVIKASW